ncbi:carbohydrate binding domain-containing protein [Cohnella fermenti]|uniref:BIG2 domain-containing protein n=1 Tax=Cohnella fermenti TaxID=2565925 RepID=A0A4S4BRA5_9BACL|nr:carbohydrate binding domain-containing protein [Cohnella fermenti]THF76697.1 hypothetical protein E6C55_18170 [Cohnella fermenti]
MRSRIISLISLLLALTVGPLFAAPTYADAVVREEVQLDSWNFQFGPDSATSPNPANWISVNTPYSWYPHLTSDDPNLVLNPGFEDGTTSWAPNPTTAVLTVDSTDKHSGEASGRITGRTAIWNAPQQDVTGLLNERGQGTYNGSFWIKLASGADTATLTLAVTATGQTTKYINLAAGAAGSASFTQISGGKNVTWEGTLTKALLYVDTKALLVDFNIDDVSMIKQVESIPTSISLGQDTANLSLGETKTVTATVLNQSGEAIDGLAIAWSSADPSVAAISNTGVITGVHAGATTIQASYGNLSAAVSVTVDPNLAHNPGFENGVASWLANPTTAVLMPDTSVKHSGDASGRISGRTAIWNAPQQDITQALNASGQGTYDSSAWVQLASGSDTATLTLAIYATGQSVKYIPLASGTANSAAFTQLSGSANVTWTGTLTKALLYVDTKKLLVDFNIDDVSMIRQEPPQATILTVNPPSLSLLPGESQSVTATVYDQNNQVMSDAPVTWISDDPIIAAINNGVVTGGSYGTSVVQAIYGSLSAVVMVTVKDMIPPLTSDNAPSGWMNNDVLVTLAASDTGSGVEDTYYTINGGAWHQGTSVLIAAEGVYTLSYWSIDKAGNSEAPHTTIVKIDKTAPLLNVQLDRTSLWPPNHKMVTIHAVLNSSDAASGVASVILTSITSNEPGGGQGDIEAALGTGATSFGLRAARSGSGTGRVYTITYTITDNAGNQSTATCIVTVPHNQ